MCVYVCVYVYMYVCMCATKCDTTVGLYLHSTQYNARVCITVCCFNIYFK